MSASTPPADRSEKLTSTAILRDGESALRTHIAGGDHLDARDDAGLKLLMLAAVKNQAGICRPLIDAGADTSAVDSTGRDAFAIAAAVGASEAARSLSATRSIDVHAGSISSDGLNYEEPFEPAPSPSAPSPKSKGEATPAPSSASEIEDLDDFGWDAEPDAPPPIDDTVLRQAAEAFQASLSAHVPIDRSADWAHVEADLPIRGEPLIAASDDAEDAEVDASRAVLLRAIREGSVPSATIEDLCARPGGERDLVAETLLRLTINDLAADIDERVEYRALYETFEVFVDPAETPTEAQLLDEAIAFIEDLSSPRNDPMRLYMRDAQRFKLVSADEEVALAKEMESAIGAAIDALSEWPAGLEWLVAEGESVRRGEKPVKSMTLGAWAEALAETVSDAADRPQSTSGALEDEPLAESESEGDASIFFANMDELTLAAAEGELGSRLGMRGALGRLRLRPAFLVQMAEHVRTDDKPGEAFVAGLRRLRSARDRMAGANLRLVNSIVKRYLFSGLPMDDLVQEGNLGLLKAVEKFDWRRGLKFSTMATWWIRQSVSRAVADTSLAIRLPVHAFESAQAILRQEWKLEMEGAPPMSPREQAALVEMEPERVVSMLRAVSSPIALDTLAEEAAPRDSVNDPVAAVMASELVRAAQMALSELPARDAKILRMRFGFDCEPATLEEIGAHLGLTRERIRQIESASLRKLSHPSRAGSLRHFLDSADKEMSLVADRQAAAKPQMDVSQGTQPGSNAASSARVKRESREIATASVEEDTDFDKEFAAAMTAPSAAIEPALTIEQLLSRARELHALVEDTTLYGERSIWIDIAGATPDGRALIAALLAAGFEHWPGRGYWI